MPASQIAHFSDEDDHRGRETPRSRLTFPPGETIFRANRIVAGV
jgi:hypothetical protein